MGNCVRLGLNYNAPLKSWVRIHEVLEQLKQSYDSVMMTDSKVKGLRKGRKPKFPVGNREDKRAVSNVMKVKQADIVHGEANINR